MLGFGRSGGGGGTVAAPGVVRGGECEMWKPFARVPEEEKLSRRIKELEETIDKLERRIKALELDWENAYDRLHSLMGRVSKRAQIAAKAEEMHEYAESQHSLTPLSPDETAMMSRMSPRHRTIQAQIMARRRAAMNGGT